MSMYSRVRASGCPNGRPYQPSTTCGPDTPIPSRNRPSDNASRVIACIAIVTGLRADICAMPVARLMRDVCAAAHTSGEKASELHDSPVQIESKPTVSTCCASSMRSRPAGGCAVQYPSWRPSLRSAVTGATVRRRAQVDSRRNP
jgi:hypothetical protein